MLCDATIDVAAKAVQPLSALASGPSQVQAEVAALLDLRTSSVVRAELSYLQNQLQAIDELEHGVPKTTARTLCSACTKPARAADTSQ